METSDDPVRWLSVMREFSLTSLPEAHRDCNACGYDFEIGDLVQAVWWLADLEDRDGRLAMLLCPECRLQDLPLSALDQEHDTALISGRLDRDLQLASVSVDELAPSVEAAPERSHDSERGDIQ